MDDDAKYKLLSNLVDKVKSCPHIIVYHNKKKYYDSTQYYPREYISETHSMLAPHTNTLYNFSNIFQTPDISAIPPPALTKSVSTNTQPLHCSCQADLTPIQHFDIKSDQYFMYPLCKMCDVPIQTDMSAKELETKMTMQPFLSEELPEYMLKPNPTPKIQEKNFAMKIVRYTHDKTE